MATIFSERLLLYRIQMKLFVPLYQDVQVGVLSLNRFLLEECVTGWHVRTCQDLISCSSDDIGPISR
jgi:hypothetical protein